MLKWKLESFGLKLIFQGEMSSLIFPEFPILMFAIESSALLKKFTQIL